MPSMGLITEGEYDICGLSPLIWRLNPTAIDIQGRPCGGPVLGQFVRTLRELSYTHPTVDKAIVVSDLRGNSHTQCLQRLQDKGQNLNLPFPVEYVIIERELEAILLADPHAIEIVCAARGRAIVLPPLNGQPDLLPDPKAELEHQLDLGGVVYTKAVAQEIAHHADLGRLDYWSPSFRRFRAVAIL